MYLRLAPSASSHFSENTSDLLDLSPHQCVPSLDPAAPPLLSPHPQIHRCWPSERSSRTTSSSMTPSSAPRRQRCRHPPGPARPHLREFVQECYELSSEYKNDQYQARLAGREVLQPRHRPRPRVLRLQQLPASTSCDFRGGNVASLRSYLHISGRGPQRRQLCEGAVCSGASTAMSRNVEASLLIEEPPPPEVGEGVDGDEGDVVLVSDEGYDVALHLHGVPSGFVLQDTPNACKMVESVWTLYKIDVVMEVVNNLRNIHCKGVADLVTEFQVRLQGTANTSLASSFLSCIPVETTATLVDHVCIVQAQSEFAYHIKFYPDLQQSLLFR
ncbi:hypothetical protein ZEAMMB73_Zm00001d046754 [Zea mays]|uniref:Uncharacterized protein n=1 Tax=Zea mays TaxID=4577 RepID=A0A1D6P4U8_MAIZE|nr:hypothetical protein ZEAMMB73_Zm00001d046754 [Zea mays]